MGGCTSGDEKYRSVYIDASEGRNQSTATEKQLASNEDIGDQTKPKKDAICDLTIASIGYLQVSVASWCVLLDFTGKDREYENLHRCTRRVLLGVSLCRVRKMALAMYKPRTDQQLHDLSE
jgi:hypothetical protein